ncbi:hypothetical protein ERJ75_000290600 [Trypanosoma vivax]|nr:hypothetical protein ERJ75_000290600 [Trypanosoma vivax]
MRRSGTGNGSGADERHKNGKAEGSALSDNITSVFHSRTTNTGSPCVRSKHGTAEHDQVRHALNRLTTAADAYGKIVNAFSINTRTRGQGAASDLARAIDNLKTTVVFGNYESNTHGGAEKGKNKQEQKDVAATKVEETAWKQEVKENEDELRAAEEAVQQARERMDAALKWALVAQRRCGPTERTAGQTSQAMIKGTELSTEVTDRTQEAGQTRNSSRSRGRHERVASTRRGARYMQRTSQLHARNKRAAPLGRSTGEGGEITSFRGPQRKRNNGGKWTTTLWTEEMWKDSGDKQYKREKRETRGTNAH